MAVCSDELLCEAFEKSFFGQHQIPNQQSLKLNWSHIPTALVIKPVVREMLPIEK